MNSFISKKLSMLGLSLVTAVGLCGVLGSPAKAQTQNATALCAGTPAADVPANVTSNMSMVASGVNVYQLTGLDKNGNVIVDQGGKVIPNYIPNNDAQNYTPLNPPSFIVTSSYSQVKTIRVDHGGAQIASTVLGSTHPLASLDGLMTVMVAKHGAGDDMLVTPLSGPGSCKSSFASNMQFVAAANQAGIPHSQPLLDSTGKYVIAFAPGGVGQGSPSGLIVYTTYHDGSHAYGPAAIPNPLTGQVTHKVRLSWQFPFYAIFQVEDGQVIGKNLHTGFIDLRTGNMVSGTDHCCDGAGGTDATDWTIFYNHDDQDTAGQWIIQASKATGGEALTTFFNPQGEFITGSNQPKKQSNPNGYDKMLPADRCFILPNGKLFCVSGDAQGARTGLKNLPTECYPAWVNDPATNKATFISCTDGHKTKSYEGYSVAGRGYTDTKGDYHALFRSDKTGTPQVFEVVFKP